MKIINLVLINGKEIPVSHLTEEDRRKMSNIANREAIAGRNYVEEKTT